MKTLIVVIFITLSACAHADRAMVAHLLTETARVKLVNMASPVVDEWICDNILSHSKRKEKGD